MKYYIVYIPNIDSAHRNDSTKAHKKDITA